MPGLSVMGGRGLALGFDRWCGRNGIWVVPQDVSQCLRPPVAFVALECACVPAGLKRQVRCSASNPPIEGSAEASESLISGLFFC